MSQRPQLLRQSVITGWVNAYFSCPSQTANVPVMAPVTVAISAVAWDVMASNGSVTN